MSRIESNHGDALRFAELKDSLTERIEAGQSPLINPIVLYDGQIVDGRHRYRACCDLGIEIPEDMIEHLPLDQNPFIFAEIANGQRRDITNIQRGISMERCRRHAEEHDRKNGVEKKAIDESATEARSEAAKEQHKVSNPRRGETKSGRATRGGTTRPKNRVTAAVAKSYGIDRKSVEIMDRLKRYDEDHGTDFIDKVHSGEMAANHAVRHIRELTNKHELERPVEIGLAPGLYRGDFQIACQTSRSESMAVNVKAPGGQKSQITGIDSQSIDFASGLEP